MNLNSYCLLLDRRRILVTDVSASASSHDFDTESKLVLVRLKVIIRIPRLFRYRSVFAKVGRKL